MNKKTLLLISLTIGITSVASAKNKLHVAGQEMPGKSSNALKTKKPIKNVKWSGVVVQTTNTEKDTCYQIIETKDSPQGKPSFDLLTYSNSFIACKDNVGDTEQYKNDLVTISGDVVSYYHSAKDNHDFPVLEIKEIKKISHTRSYVKSSSNGNSRGYSGSTFYGGSRPSKSQQQRSLAGTRGSINK